MTTNYRPASQQLLTKIIDKNTDTLHNPHKMYEFFCVVCDRYTALHRIARGQLGLFTARQSERVLHEDCIPIMN